MSIMMGKYAAIWSVLPWAACTVLGFERPSYISTIAGLKFYIQSMSRRR